MLLSFGCQSVPPRAPGIGGLKTPHDVAMYLEKSVGKDTLRKWDSHVSDDAVLVQIYDQNGNKTGSAIAQ
jgi:hypothetical protein